MRNHLLLILLFLVGVANGQTTAAEYAKKAFDKTMQNDFNEALKLYKKAIELDSSKYYYYVNVAHCYHSLKRKADADNTVTGMLKKYNDKWNAYTAASHYYTTVKEFYTALDLMEEAVKKFPVLPDSALVHLYGSRGAAKFDLMNFDGAKSDFLYAYKIDTTNANAWNNLALTYSQLGLTDSSIYFYNKILNKKPDDMLCYNNLGFLYNNLGRYYDAVALYNKAFDYISKNKSGIGVTYAVQTVGLLHSNCGFALYKLGDNKKAFKEFEESIKYFPTNSYVYKNRALTYIAVKKNTEACQDLYHALSLGFADQYGDEVDKLIEQYCK